MSVSWVRDAAALAVVEVEEDEDEGRMDGPIDCAGCCWE